MVAFDSILITFPDQSAADSASQGPLQNLLKEHPKVHIHATTDPYGVRVGSGGGTVSALQETRGQTSLVLHAGGASSRCPTQMVLGKAWTSLPCYDDRVSTPLHLWIDTCRLWFERSLPVGSIVVVATDTLVQVDLQEGDSLDWSKHDPSAVVGLAVPAPVATASRHGVYQVTTNDNRATNIQPCRRVYQKPSVELLHQDRVTFPSSISDESLAWIDTGVIVFLPQAAATLRQLASSGPLQACTRDGLRTLWEGTGSNFQSFAEEKALSIDLYTHILQALSLEADGNDKTAYRSEYLKEYEGSAPVAVLEGVYDAMVQHSLHIWTIPTGRFLHLGTTRELHDFILFGCTDGLMDASLADGDEVLIRRRQLCRQFGETLGLSRRTQSLLLPETFVAPCSVIVQSMVIGPVRIGARTVVEHCCLLAREKVSIGVDCLVSGLRPTCLEERAWTLPDQMIMQMVPFQNRSSKSGGEAFVLVVLGLDDGIKSRSTLFGLPVDEFLAQLGLKESDLWEADVKQILWTAKLHPILSNNKSVCDVYGWLDEYCRTGKCSLGTGSLEQWKTCQRLSLSELRDQASACHEFAYRHVLSRLRLCASDAVQGISERRHTTVVVQDVVDDAQWWTRDAILSVFCSALQEAESALEFDVASRVARVLSSYFFGNASASNQLDILPKCISTLLKVRPETNYDEVGVQFGRLSQHHTHLCLSRWLTKLDDEPSPSPSIFNQWVVATAPVRIDLSGGWSDTPPVCYEFGSAVTGVAVTVDGQRPLSSRCRIQLTAEQNEIPVVLRSERRNTTGTLESATQVCISCWEDMEDYKNPQADGALLKAALICLGLVRPGRPRQTDRNAFQRAVNHFCMSPEGQFAILEIVVTSLLPQGSGMGTSSILGGCALAAISKCTGNKQHFLDAADTASMRLMEAVLLLEQHLTTGGGFQDQVHGLFGGFKMVHCQPATPHNDLSFSLQLDHISPPASLVDSFNARLRLAFTGQTRLAKNLLQTVLQQWSCRQPLIVDTMQSLVEEAKAVRVALKEGNLETVARLWRLYGQHKATLAGPTSVPQPVKEAVAQWGDRVATATLCGAGGGGFLAVLTSAPENILDDIPGFTWHDCAVCNEGLIVSIAPVNGSGCKNMGDFDMTWHEP